MNDKILIHFAAYVRREKLMSKASTTVWDIMNSKDGNASKLIESTVGQMSSASGLFKVLNVAKKGNPTDAISVLVGYIYPRNIIGLTERGLKPENEKATSPGSMCTRVP
jgi:hypothetical protein